MFTPISSPWRHLARVACLTVVGAVIAIGAGTIVRSPALAQADAIQSQDTNESGVVAEITQCKRKDGVLTRGGALPSRTEMIEPRRHRDAEDARNPKPSISTDAAG